MNSTYMTVLFFTPG